MGTILLTGIEKIFRVFSRIRRIFFKNRRKILRRRSASGENTPPSQRRCIAGNTAFFLQHGPGSGGINGNGRSDRHFMRPVLCQNKKYGGKCRKNSVKTTFKRRENDVKMMQKLKKVLTGSRFFGYTFMLQGCLLSMTAFSCVLSIRRHNML